MQGFLIVFFQKFFQRLEVSLKEFLEEHHKESLQISLEEISEGIPLKIITGNPPGLTLAIHLGIPRTLAR